MALSSELASMDFGSLVGGPLVAAVNAQAQASIAASNFILKTAFVDPDNPSELRTITMKVNKTKIDGTTELVEITVPLLTILQVPNLRISEYDYEFNAKINSVDTSSTNTEFKANASLQAKAGWGWGSAKLNASASFKKETKEGNTTSRDYQMKIKVRAISDQLPGGLEKLLGLLESNISG